jgi:hypothetical protein
MGSLALSKSWLPCSTALAALLACARLAGAQPAPPEPPVPAVKPLGDSPGSQPPSEMYRPLSSGRIDLNMEKTGFQTDTPALVTPPDSAPLPTLSPAVDSPLGSANGLFNTRVGQAVPRATYSVLGIPSESVKGQPTNLSVVRQDLSLSTPIWQCPTDEFMLTAHLHNEIIDTGAVIPNSTLAFPHTLWDVRLGVSYRHQFENGWTAGTSVNVGSASDKPFHSIHEITEGVSAFLRIPQGERNAWLFSISYSPTAQVNFPIPMVAYIWWPSDYFRAQIGLPLQVMYRPTEDVTLEASYMLLTSVRGQVIYRVAPQFRLHAGYDFSNEGFFLAERLDTQERFFSYEQRVSAGAQYTFNRHASIDLSSGYVFGRYYFEGHSLHATNGSRVDVDDGWFIGLRFVGRW